MMARIIDTLSGLGHLDELVDDAERDTCSESIFERCRLRAGIDMTWNASELASIPKSGPLIIVANHPTGFAEGLALPALLERARQDIWVLGHQFFTRWAPLAQRMILVDPQAGPKDRRSNHHGFRQALSVLRRGAVLVVFPAGVVACPAGRKLEPLEAPWRTGFVRLVQASGAAVIPIHVSGCTGFGHRVLSRLHPRLGVIALAHELERQQRRPMSFTVGTHLTARWISSMPANEASSQLRRMTIALGSSIEHEAQQYKRAWQTVS